MRIHSKMKLFGLLDKHLISYPTPLNLSWNWNYGSLSGVVLFCQIITGVLLAMHYTAHTDYAFSSIQHIMFDVPSGLFLRYSHANGASLFFIVVYVHILRGLYYGSYTQPRELVWVTGVIIVLLMIITAFIGYVLPWGQMSFWGTTVITSLATTIPLVGKQIVCYLWGGFSIDNPTLNRFYSLHYTLPFILVGLSIFHIAALHEYGSSNPLGINTAGATIQFGPYFSSKDMLGVLVLLLLFAYLVFFNPDLLGHSDNLIPANPYTTPTHIVPEWYFLWAYAILRSIPNKSMGVLGIGLTFASLLSLPFLSTVPVGAPRFRLIYEKLYWILVSDLFLLTWVGAQEIMPATVLLGQICSIILFVYFCIVLPILGWFETVLYEHGVKSGCKA